MASETVHRNRLRTACVLAHEYYEGNDDVDVANYDDEESFVQEVTDGFWVEAFIWVPTDAVEQRLSQDPEKAST